MDCFGRGRRAADQPAHHHTLTIRIHRSGSMSVAKLLAAIDKARPRSSSTSRSSKLTARACGSTACRWPPPAPPASTALPLSTRHHPAQPAHPDAVRHPDVGVPALYYRLLKTDSNTRTLANPHIRTVDGVLAWKRWASVCPSRLRRSCPSGRRQQPAIDSNFTYEPIGINIDVTPRFHANTT